MIPERIIFVSRGITVDPLHKILCKGSIYFLEGPDGDSNGIETFRPNPINNILLIVVFD